MAEAPGIGGLGLVDGAVEKAQGDAAVRLVGEQASLAGDHDAGALRIALVGDDDAMERQLRRRDLVDVDDELAERGREGALRDAGGRTALEDLEELLLEGADRPRDDHEGEPADEHRHEQCGDDEGPEQAKRAHPGRLERRHLEIPGEAAAHEQHGDEQGHGQCEAQERGQHEDEERQDELEGHVLGDDEIGELVDPVDDEKEREDADADGEGRDELLPHIAIEESHHRSLIVR